MSNYTRLGGSVATFDQMIRKFGVVTVMNAHVYQYDKTKVEGKTADAALKSFYTPATGSTAGSWATGGVTLDTLKIANVPMEGPTKTVTGGQYNNPLIKYGKTARLEMQDALGNVDAIEMMGGGFVERYGGAVDSTNIFNEPQMTGTANAFHVGQDCAGPVTIVGDSFFIDQKTGQQVKVKIIFYQLLPDSIFNLTQDADGDATVFDMNGDLLATNILVGNVDGGSELHGLFYSILPAEGVTAAAN